MPTAGLRRRNQTSRRNLRATCAYFIEFETLVKVLDTFVPSALTAKMIATEMHADQARRNEGLST